METKTLSQKGMGWAKKHPILSVIGVIFIIGLIGSIVDPSEKKPDEPKLQEQVQQVVFDVPSLIGKNIDEIEFIYGKEESQEPNEYQINTVTEWSKEFKRDEFILLVTYDYKTRVVKDFFVSATDEIYESRDKDRMMSITNTNKYDSKYSVSFVKAMTDSTRFTGIQISPK